jgi:hypothetical protein
MRNFEVLQEWKNYLSGLERHLQNRRVNRVQVIGAQPRIFLHESHQGVSTSGSDVRQALVSHFWAQRRQ